jgi:sugar lactone lactonase YvrE
MVVAIGLSAAVSLGVTLAWAGGTTVAPAGRLPTWQVVVGAESVPHLAQPTGLAIDTRGTSAQKWMYVVDTGKNRIVKLGTGGHYLGSWGSRGTAPGQFEHPQSIAVDSQGVVYVADTGNNRIQKFSPSGQVLATWGTKGSGPGQFDGPSGVAVGGSGNVFVADRNNKRIEKFSPFGQLLAVWPAFIPSQPCTPGFCFPGGLGAPGPYALAVDRAGNVYAAVDTGECSAGHCVMDYIALQTFAPSGKITRTVVGGNPYGQFAYGPIPGVTSVKGPWWQIGALTTDSAGHLYLTNWGPSVVEITSTGKLLGQWQQPPSKSGSPGQGIAIDPRGSVYVADTADNSVLKLVFHP